LLQRLRDALAQSPPVPTLFLLVAAGMAGPVAKALLAKYPEARVRLACHYVACNSTANPAGLLRAAVEHEAWDLT